MLRVRVDQRLLNEQLWQSHPGMVYRLLKDMAAQGTEHHLAKLAATYLVTSEKLSSTAAPNATELDYLLVLGNVLNDDASPRPELITRLTRTLFMSRTNPKARLMVSGGAHVGDIKEADVMKKWLTDRGVCAERIVLESKSRDTVENIKMSTDLLTKQNANRVGLITGIKGAGRTACLLPAHLNHIGSTILAEHVTPTDCEPTVRTLNDFARERFLLFKDLGRILGIWKYRSWAARPLLIK